MFFMYQWLGGVRYSPLEMSVALLEPDPDVMGGGNAYACVGDAFFLGTIL